MKDALIVVAGQLNRLATSKHVAVKHPYRLAWVDRRPDGQASEYRIGLGEAMSRHIAAVLTVSYRAQEGPGRRVVRVAADQGSDEHRSVQ